MFGIGFTELLLIAIIAILFLGPDKLPEAMIQIAKFIKGVKKTVGEAKASLEEEMRIADLKEEALNYKKQLDEATDELKNFKNIELDDLDDTLHDIVYDSPAESASPSKDPYAQAPREIPKEVPDTPEVEPKRETVTFTKKPKEQPKSKKKRTPSSKEDSAEAKSDSISEEQ